MDLEVLSAMTDDEVLVTLGIYKKNTIEPKDKTFVKRQ
jgi:hypothetical protein